jgi:hypothetical protein
MVISAKADYHGKKFLSFNLRFFTEKYLSIKKSSVKPGGFLFCAYFKLKVNYVIIILDINIINI